MTTTQPPRAQGQGMTLLGKAPTEPVALTDVAVLLNPDDAVAIAKQPLLPRTVLKTDSGEVRVAQMIPPGHKVALRAVAEGGEVRRYGQIIGFATKDISPGDHVHSHNLSVGAFPNSVIAWPCALGGCVVVMIVLQALNVANFTRHSI